MTHAEMRELRMEKIRTRAAHLGFSPTYQPGRPKRSTKKLFPKLATSPTSKKQANRPNKHSNHPLLEEYFPTSKV